MMIIALIALFVGAGFSCSGLLTYAVNRMDTQSDRSTFMLIWIFGSLAPTIFLCDVLGAKLLGAW